MTSSLPETGDLGGVDLNGGGLLGCAAAVHHIYRHIDLADGGDPKFQLNLLDIGGDLRHIQRIACLVLQFIAVALGDGLGTVDQIYLDGCVMDLIHHFLRAGDLDLGEVQLRVPLM